LRAAGGVRARAFPLLAGALIAAALFMPSAAAMDDGMEVHVVTVRHVEVTLRAQLPGPAGDALRAAVDGNGDATVSGEEYAVYVSGLETVAFLPPMEPIALYALVWELENTTGAGAFTAAGRFNLSLLLGAQAPGVGLAATMDGQAGAGRVSYLTMAGLAGPVASNATVVATLVLRYAWEGLSPHGTHTLSVRGPPEVSVEVRLPGGSLATNVTGLSGHFTGASGTFIQGKSTAQPLVVTIAPRGASSAGLFLAVGLIGGAAAVAAYGAAVVSRRHERPTGVAIQPEGQTE
jgi:hypothetical protein